MARSPFSKPARPRAGKAPVKTPALPKPKSNQRPTNVGPRSQGTGTTPGFSKRIITTDAKKTVAPAAVPQAQQIGGKTVRPPR